MKELKITKEKVLEASENCPDAKGVLKTLFPEAFKEKWKDVTKEVKWSLHQNSKNYEYWLEGDYKASTIIIIDKRGIIKNLDSDESIKIEFKDDNFCIFSKE